MEDRIEIIENNSKFKNMKRLISINGNSVCRMQFYNEDPSKKDYINTCLKNFNLGFIIISDDNSNHSRNPNRRIILKAYTLFKVDNDTIFGLISCAKISPEGTQLKEKYGIRLFREVYKYARENNIIYWKINSLPSERLIKYYESFGFNQDGITYHENGDIKVVNMSMNINDNINNSILNDI